MVEQRSTLLQKGMSVVKSSGQDILQSQLRLASAETPLGYSLVAAKITIQQLRVSILHFHELSLRCLTGRLNEVFGLCGLRSSILWRSSRSRL